MKKRHSFLFVFSAILFALSGLENVLIIFSSSAGYSNLIVCFCSLLLAIALFRVMEFLFQLDLLLVHWVAFWARDLTFCYS